MKLWQDSNRINYLRFCTVYNKKCYNKKAILCKKQMTNPKTMN